MKTDTKSAHEILLNSEMSGGSNDFLDRMICVMEEYADQFKPKWIPCLPVHDLNEGIYVFSIGTKGYTKTDRVMGVVSSNIFKNASHYFKVITPNTPDPCWD